jgi:hypothetical protein
VRDNPWQSNSPGSEEHVAGYDYSTLAYDVFFPKYGEEIIIFAPRLLNFEEVITKGTFRLDRQVCVVQSIRKRHKHAEIRLKLKTRAKGNHPKLSLEYKGNKISCVPNVQDLDSFQGQRCLIAISRDNRLEWIHDWGKHHVEKQGVQGILLIDNNSSRYDVRELAKTLNSIDGLENYRILRCPFSYGPKEVKSARFLQNAMLNLARTRFLSEAHGVLSVDIDELVLTKGGLSIFELADRSLFGFCTFDGRWVFPKKGMGGSVRHGDHLWREKQLDQGGPYQKGKLKKFCVNPKKQIGMGWWKVHGSPYMLNRLAYTHQAQYFHFWGVSTDWKNSRKDLPENLEFDPRLEKCLQHLKRSG